MLPAFAVSLPSLYLAEVSAYKVSATFRKVGTVSSGNLTANCSQSDVTFRRRIVVVARAIGRFEIRQILQDKPFTIASVKTIQDEQPQTFQHAATTSTAAMQLWQCMQQVSDLASKLYEHTGPLGNVLYSPAYAAVHGVDFTARLISRNEYEYANTVNQYPCSPCCPHQPTVNMLSMKQFLKQQYNA